MRQITYFGKDYSVRFDTDPEPTKKRVKRGMTCTLMSETEAPIVARAECSIKDTFKRETGEALSLNRALEMISNKIIKAEKRKAFVALSSKPKIETASK